MAMPTNSSTQSISFLQMQNEYGGSNPINFSEYYLGSSNGYVPYTVYRTVQDWVARGYTAGTNGVEKRTITASGAVSWKWIFNGVEISTTAAGANNTTVYISNAYYSTGYASGTSSGTDKAGRPYTQRNYPIYRYEYTSVGFAENRTIPTSGTISMSQLYGGTKT